MADVKFMDLSQNDNPATTDSVLIGNSADGLKRTTVGAIGDLFAVKGLLHFETITGTNNPKSPDPNAKNSIGIKAPDVPGYTFAFWLTPSTRGNIVPGYIEYADANPATVWLKLSDGDVDPVNVVAIAVYVNSKVA
ncbi:hypothetical protein QUW45_02220 [Limosilactobacillus pontis]|uniref:hypothetical protein n=1 Tax=Limosilactobacillus pontis TaxID=35787 RepID=UPI0025A3BBBF|nr:hypothetical protein [Limosilactobacillus pontis]MDM8331505.1 hypothetical protein [Limosilactobacillus pontis]